MQAIHFPSCCRLSAGNELIVIFNGHLAVEHLERSFPKLTGPLQPQFKKWFVKCDNLLL